MVSKDSAADYARYRAHLHAHATREITGAMASGRTTMPSASPTAGTAPTDCSGRSTQGACHDDLLSAWAHTPVGDDRVCTRHAAFFGILGRSRRTERAMKVLMVSWEYPPVVIGGLGRHVHHLATALADAGHEVVVLSRRPSGTDPSSTRRRTKSPRRYGLSPRRRTRTSSTSAAT